MPKLNFLSLTLPCKSCESRFRQNFKKKFDWPAFNSVLCMPVASGRTAIAHDHSYMKMSGKKTPGIGHCWSGCAGTTKRCLEILGFAQVAAGVSDARFLFAAQTLDQKTRGRTPFYLEHMKDKRDNQTAKCLRTILDHREQLLGISRILVGDCLFASYSFVQGASCLGFDVVSRRRDDAVLQYLYNGSQKDDRKKEIDGQADISALREGVFAREGVSVDGEVVTIFSAIVKSKSLKRRVKVVVVEFKCGDKTHRKIVFSTDLTMEVSEMFLVYHSRFQIEFLFRDAKQNTGLEGWQSTYADRLSFGYNASLSAVNVAREMADKIQQETGRRLSVASVKKVLHMPRCVNILGNLLRVRNRRIRKINLFCRKTSRLTYCFSVSVI